MTYDDVIANIHNMRNCYVIAPAGCGKTQMICNIANKSSEKVLLLTHTNAGVDVMQSRLNNTLVKVSTISSFVNKYVNSYKALAELQDVEIDYENQYKGFIKLLNNKIIREVLSYNYKMIFIDEFQDCTKDQCDVVNGLSRIIPIKVFGDEMQSIFNFETVANFVDLEGFECAGELMHPWRWENNKPLGNWTIRLRADYDNRFENAIKEKEVTIISEDYFYSKYYSLLNKNMRNCIVTKRKAKSISIARRLYGYYVLEELEMRDLKTLAKEVNNNSLNRVIELLIIVKDSCVKSGDYLNKYIEKLKKGDTNFSRLKDTKMNSIVENLITNFSIKHLDSLLTYLSNNNCRIIRYELIYYCYYLIKEYSLSNGLTDAQIENFFRKVRRIDLKSVVAHTLLIKGLEYDNCAVFKSELTNNELYVAYTRAKNKLYIIE